jgi:hypothetical protein
VDIEPDDTQQNHPEKERSKSDQRSETVAHVVSALTAASTAETGGKDGF